MKEKIINYIETLEAKAYQSDDYFKQRNDLYIENQNKDKELERLNNIINELDKQNGELGADLSIIKDRVIKTNWWLEKMLEQATNRETKAIINGALDLLLGSESNE